MSIVFSTGQAEFMNQKVIADNIEIREDVISQNVIIMEKKVKSSFVFISIVSLYYI